MTDFTLLQRDLAAHTARPYLHRPHGVFADQGNRMSEEGEGKSNQQIAFEKQIGGASHNLPRTARARVGATTDPVPDGKKVAEPV